MLLITFSLALSYASSVTLRNAGLLRAARAPQMSEQEGKRLVLITDKVPSYKLLCDAVLPAVDVLEVDFHGGRDPAPETLINIFDNSNQVQDDMNMMIGKMMGKVGTTYDSIGVMDCAGPIGLSLIHGHLVPREMLGSEPDKAPNFIMMCSFLRDQFLFGMPVPAEGEEQKATPPEEPLGAIDLLGCEGVSTAGMDRVVSGVGEWSMGLEKATRYFDSEKLDVWKEAAGDPSEWAHLPQA